MKRLRKYIGLAFAILAVAGYMIIKLPAVQTVINPPGVQKKSLATLISQEMAIGSKGDQVKILQSALSTDKEVYPSGIVSGYYGDLTHKAVSNFQDKYDIKVTGEVDKKTADKFNMVYGDRTSEYYLGLVPTQPVVEIQLNKPIETAEEWGKARQIGEHTWTMNVGMDDRMATPQEIFDALNNYRRLHGKNTLYWDDILANYATERAKYFTQIGDLDSHAGFAEFVKSEENVRSLGFWALGENSSFGYRLSGTHLIEWVYAGDKPHDDNQLNSDWTHVGIGVDGNQTNLIFGGHEI